MALGLAQMRVLAIAFVFATYFLLSEALYISLHSALIFCHYIMAFALSGKYFQKNGYSLNAIVLIVSLTTLYLSYVNYLFLSLSFLVLFLIHFVFSEVYTYREERDNDDKIFKTIRFLFTFLLFAVASRNDPLFELLPPLFYLISFLSIFAVFAIYWFLKIRQQDHVFSKSDVFSFEAAGLAYGLALYFWMPTSTVKETVFYHASFWFFMFFKKRQEKLRNVAVYVFATVAILGLLFVFDKPIFSFQQGYYDLWTYARHFALVHILFSFIISPSNPLFVRQFNPALRT